MPDVNPWTNAARLTPVPGGVVSLVEGSTFAISDTAGDIIPPGPLGLFYHDTRFLSRLQLLVNGERPEPLAARPVDPYSARFVLRLPWSGPGESPLVAVRSRFVGDGLHEDLDVTNHGDAPAELRLEFLLDADFADLFEVKMGGPRLATPGDVARRPWHDKARLEMVHGPGQVVGIQMSCRPDELSETGAVFAVTLAPGETWHTCFDVYVTVEGVRSRPKCRCDAFGTLSDPLAGRAMAWCDRFPSLRSGWDALDHLYARSIDDLAALLMEDPDGAGDMVVAAGLPWFMALFGRDAILTALMALPFDRELAAGVLGTLARHQGEKEDEASEEEPGRIPHEIRFGEVAARAGRRVYYGTVDATALFVTLAAEAWRWGLAWTEVEALLPNVRRALEWMRTFGDPDGDGYIEYSGRAGRGLRNQGWKDHWDAIQFADGRLADGPVALCEVQGYAFRALGDAADLFEAAGASRDAERLRGQASDLARCFRRDFWMESAGFPALALDGAKRPVDAIASNAGHLLWTGILSTEQQAAVARRLVSPELFSGWGLRTLATSNRGYRPVSYHVGGVWPHDTAIAVAGLARAGFREEASTLAAGLMAAGGHFAHRLPELFSGFDRTALGFPVPYPTACSPQAWSAATPLLLLRVLLGLEPDPATGGLCGRPVLPSDALPLRLDGIAGGTGRSSLPVDGTGAIHIDFTPDRNRPPQR